jgi:hypothetical protein
MDPAYQRGYVWTTEQKQAYVEFILKGGESGRDIYWNCAGWMKSYRGTLELVDGKQRISAVLDFLDNKLKVFGHLYSEYEDASLVSRYDFVFHVNDLEHQSDVVRWYIDMNTGGSVHTEKDLEPAYEELKRLEKEENYV